MRTPSRTSSHSILLKTKTLDREKGSWEMPARSSGVRSCTCIVVAGTLGASVNAATSSTRTILQELLYSTVHRSHHRCVRPIKVMHFAHRTNQTRSFGNKYSPFLLLSTRRTNYFRVYPITVIYSKRRVLLLVDRRRLHHRSDSSLCME